MILIGFVGTNMLTQQFYVAASRASLNSQNANFVEIRGVSEERFAATLPQLFASLPSNVHTIISDSWNVSLGQMETFYARGRTIVFPVFDMQFIANFSHDPVWMAEALRIQSIQIKAERIGRYRRAYFHQARFLIPLGSGKVLKNVFSIDHHYEPGKRGDNTMVLVSLSDQAPLNRLHSDPEQKGLAFVPLSSIHNWIVFVDSTLGRSYVAHNLTAAMYQLEPDLYYPGLSMAGIGRFLQFEVLGASPKVRACVWISDTLAADGRNLLPPMAVVGMERSPYPIGPRGSARWCSGPIHPRRVSGRDFIALDFGRPGRLFKTRRHGLMQLFGKDIIIDSRRLTAFARDISLVDEDEYRRFKAPTSISKFEDLRNYDLEYAGIYEDLWFSDSAFVVLKSRKTDKVFNFAGVVPNIGNPNFSTRLTISIGKTKRTFPLKVGEFLVTVPVRSGETTQRVSFSFDSYQHLPFGDDRPVTLKLHYLGFSENPGESVQ